MAAFPEVCSRIIRDCCCPAVPQSTKVRLAYIEQIDDEQQEHHPASLKASGPPGIWLKGSPLM